MLELLIGCCLGYSKALNILGHAKRSLVMALRAAKIVWEVRQKYGQCPKMLRTPAVSIFCKKALQLGTSQQISMAAKILAKASKDHFLQYEEELNERYMSTLYSELIHTPRNFEDPEKILERVEKRKRRQTLRVPVEQVPVEHSYRVYRPVDIHRPVDISSSSVRSAPSRIKARFSLLRRLRRR